MKLIYHIIIRLSIVLSIVLAIWAILFYIRMINEINDETDDSLEDYAEQIIMRQLAGEEIPSENNNSNNQYYLKEITWEEAQSKPHIHYMDSMIYIPLKRETEPARILTTVYMDDSGRFHELVVAIPTIEKKDLKEAILYWMIFLYFGLLLCILIVNIWVYHQSNKPLHKLLGWLNRYKIGRENIALNNDTDITEYKKLNEAVVQSMQRSEKVFEEQKQFIGNASHEIQTPLAVCRNRLENLMEDDSLTESQLEELSKTLQTLEQITRLNKTLLLLSRIENNQFSGTTEIEFNSMIKKNLQDYKEVYTHLNINVEIKESGIFKIMMNETLAEILINNIIKNAFVHNVTDGKIIIETSASKLIFKNSGQEFALDSQLIFKRFYQGNKKPESSGLGLALIKSICDQEKLHIDYFFENNFHCFNIYP
ncbi:HAMP domain-containing sensor histidine kinase [Proteiniphilum sp.]|uniref:sensor histidine kinase n=1 Tax=Proteiniphilum sp. TaxID=1926877 RepID=UPI002B218E6B|nr:HAMP domain-containing sensor histidine kinase [Proteiniphilum sp.]MEA4916149.1 HAMP domain-containing sensor histidine kinase [Proteiniphilum sp.]